MSRFRAGRYLAQSLVIAGLLLGAGSALAYPHRGEHMVMTQPDGSSVEVVVWGDEFYARVESLDGYTLVLDPVTRWICYATSTQDGDLVTSGIHFTGDQSTTVNGLPIPKTKPTAEGELRRRGIARGLRHAPDKIEKKIRASQQQLWGGAAPPSGAPGTAPASAPYEEGLVGAVTGSIKGLVVAIDFSDRVGTISQTELDNAFNGASYGDSRGSIRTWSETISYSMVTVSHQIVAYMRAAYPTTHYQYGTDYAASDELMKEVFAYIENNVDLTPLGVSGALPSLAVLYAGATISNGWATALWPHSGCGRYTTSEGVRINSCYLSNLGTSVPLRLGTHRHELGHAIFKWPDTYDYDDDSRSAGGFAMEEDLPCAPFRMWAGWMKVTDITSTTNQLYSLVANGDTCLRYVNPADSKEYFVIEYLKKEGWNAAAPDQGLLVWHIDDNTSRSNNSWQDNTATRHYRLAVEQADGQLHLEHNTKAGDGDLFHAGDKTRFDATTTPNSNWWAGTASGLTLCDIGGLNASMSVNVGCAGGGAGGSAATGGGSATGGQGTGGRATGGTSSGGRATGGQATGGQPTGGQATGGQATGGKSSGGSAVTASGGSLGVGGSALSSGGASIRGGSPGTGGQDTGGTAGSGGTGGSPEQNCNCSVPGSERRSPWMLLPLLGLLAVRRRRRAAR